MRAALILVTICLAFEVRGEPCGPGLSLGRPAQPEAACDGDDIEIARACHCTIERKDLRPWGKTADLALSMPAGLKIVSGESTDIPLTLRYRGALPVELDFPGGDVVYATEIRRGGRRIERPPCGELTVLPQPIRLKLRPGSTVRGTVEWKAATYPHDWCPGAEDLPAGRYDVTFTTVSGEAPLTATVAVTVVGRVKKKAR